MKKIFLLLAPFLSFGIVGAQTFSYDNLNFEVTSTVLFAVEVTTGSYGSLTSLNIPQTVTYNGTVYTVTSICEYAFGDCKELTSVVLPNSLTSMAGWVFDGCNKLTDVKLSENMEVIPQFTFLNCKINSIEIPECVTTFEKSAFERCPLRSITFPKNVTYIGEDCFEECTYLREVYSLNTTPPTLHEEAFEDCDVYSKGTLYVPNESLELYKTASVWRKFTNILPIENDDTTLVESITFEELQTFDIYTLDGKLIKSDSNKEFLQTLNKGMYILRNAGKSLKIAL